MFINYKKNKFFFFGNSLDNKNNLLKFKNISYIYLWDSKSTKDEVLQIKNFCKKNKIKFYISNNINMAKLIKADGVHIPSYNKKIIYNNNPKFHIVGTAHSSYDYYIKITQKCEGIFLSPLFYTEKYSINRILGPVKFNLMSKNWKKKIYVLGGIKINNIKRVNTIRCAGIGGISFFK
jgi:thiamine-phosphate pyrophosphorylase